MLSHGLQQLQASSRSACLNVPTSNNRHSTCSKPVTQWRYRDRGVLLLTLSKSALRILRVL